MLFQEASDLQLQRCDSCSVLCPDLCASQARHCVSLLCPVEKGSAASAFSHLPQARRGLLCTPRHRSPSATTSFRRLFPPLCTLVPKATLILPLPLHPKPAFQGAHQDAVAWGNPVLLMMVPCVTLFRWAPARSCAAGPGKPGLCSPAVLRSQEARPSLYHVTAVISEDMVGFLVELSGRGRSQHLVWLGLPWLIFSCACKRVTRQKVLQS